MELDEMAIWKPEPDVPAFFLQSCFRTWFSAIINIKIAKENTFLKNLAKRGFFLSHVKIPIDFGVFFLSKDSIAKIEKDGYNESS